MEIVSKKSATSFTATVDVFEMMGKESFVYYSLGKTNFVTKVESKVDYPLGSKIFVNIKPEIIYFFDPLTKNRIDL